MSNNLLKFALIILIVGLLIITIYYLFIFVFKFLFKRRLASYLKNRFSFAVFFYLNLIYIIFKEPNYLVETIPLVWFFACLCLLEPIISQLFNNFTLNLNKFFSISQTANNGMAFKPSQSAPLSPKKRLIAFLIVIGHFFGLISLVAYDLHLLLNQLKIVLNFN